MNKKEKMIILPIIRTKLYPASKKNNIVIITLKGTQLLGKKYFLTIIKIILSTHLLIIKSLIN